MDHKHLKIDPDFRDKIPHLTEEEFQKLEENIVSDGEVRDPIVTWKDTIIDGHNRWKIIQKHPEIPYRVKEMEFADKWDAIRWMCGNQLGRRNLSEYQRDYILQQEYEARKKSVTNESGVNQHTKVVGGQNDHQPKVRESMAKEHGITEMAVRRAVEFGRGLEAADEVVPGFKEMILSGEVKTPKSTIAEIRKMEPEEMKKAVESILSGEPKKAPPKKVGFPKEARQVKQDIADIVADMYDSDSDYEYGVSDLVDEIKVNTEAFVKMLHRTTDIRREVFSGNERNKQEVISAINEYAIAEINRIMEVIKSA